MKEKQLIERNLPFNKKYIYTELKKGKKYESNGFMLYVLNDKNKQIDCFLHDLQKFFPELI